MDTFLLENWNTLRGTSATSIIQSEPRWLDLAAYREMVVWLDVREFTSAANVAIALQTAPAKEESLFATSVSFTGAGSLVTGVTTALVAPETIVSPNVPLSRWLRWKTSFSGAGTSDVTFRIWIAANKPGRASTNRGAAMSR